jgi:S1-C subfamily serine protease
MTRFRAFALVLCVASVFCLAAVAALPADDKEKPKDAPTLDDGKATVTETVDGKEKTSKLDLKYALKVKGYFANDGFHIEEVDGNGPAARLDDGNGNGAMMEKGDIIVEVDGKPVKSPKDYAKAMNGAADHSKTKLKIKDVNTGNDQTFYADAEKL